MRNQLRSLSAIAFAALILALPARPIAAQDMGIPIGTRPGPAVVRTLDGKVVDLSRYIGKVPVMIEFWATWCPNCKELMPALTAAEKKYGKRVKFIVVAVAINQSPAKVKRYLGAHPQRHEMLFDTDGAAAEAFDAPATSYVVMLDKSGRVVYTGLGGKQDLDAAVRKGL